MNLTDTGESRVNGYLFVLRRFARRVFAGGRQTGRGPRNRVALARAHRRGHARLPTRRATLETILAELGPPLRVAQAYSAERTIDEAMATGRFVPMLRAIRHVSGKTVAGFWRPSASRWATRL